MSERARDDADSRARWQRIEALFDVALDLPANERDAFLRETCGADESLRLEILRLMEAGESPSTVLDEPAAVLANVLSAEADDGTGVPAPPKRIGPYRVIRELGQGGMGAVYLGERDDGEFRQTVALKLVRRGLHHDPRILRRFREERQILASLQHPDIARLLDGGLTEDGLPYFAMEYVAGESIDRFCDAQCLSVDRRLALFVRVCEAMAHAHARGIVHRDIKPSNILVEVDGTPRLLDFGIAKLAIAPNDYDGSNDLTRTGERILTPEYASPEQIRGEPIAPATDVYALGVLLYELLTGCRPFGRDGRPAHEIERAVLEQEPLRPSSAIVRQATSVQVAETSEQVCAARGSTPARLKLRLRGDVDAIVLQALRKEADRRYPTARELGEDVQRHLAGRAVLARGDSWGYRTRRLMRRHRTGVAIAVATALLTTSVAVGVSLGNRSERLVPGATRRVVFDAALELDPALSPDGTRLVYTTDAHGPPRLYLLDLQTGRSAPLTDSAAAQRAPHWSPDGTQVAFQSGDRIYTVPAAGGAARVLIESESTARWVSYPAWSPDGRELAYVQDDTVYVRSAFGGSPRFVTAAARDAHSLAWSPDGRWIAFVDGNSAFVFGVWRDETLINLGNAGPSSIWVVRSTGGAPVRVTDDASLSVSPVWLPNGRTLLFVSNLGGERDVYRVDLAGDGRPSRAPTRLTTGLGAHTIALSADGRRLAYAVFRNHANIWSAPLPDSGSTSDEGLRQVTRGTQSIEGVSVSPNGRWLAFDSDRHGNQDIYRMPIDGGDPIQLTTSPADDFMPYWSPDGAEIVYYTFGADRTRQLQVVSSGGGASRPVADVPRDQRSPSWSPDGRSLVFSSNGGEGPQRLYVLSRDSAGAWGAARRLPAEVGIGPRWSPDGHEIAYAGAGGIWTIDPEGGEPRRLLQIDSADEKLGNLEWRRDGRAILYKLFEAGGRASFWSVSDSGGEPLLLVRLDGRLRAPRPEFATDQRRVYFTVAERESDIWTMELASVRR